MKRALIFFITLLLFVNTNVYAATCPLGKEVTQDLANILNIIQIAGPIIVIVVTVIEVVKTTSKGNIQEESKKLGKRLLKRVIYAILLFFVPVIVETGAKIAQIDVSSCDLSNPADNNYKANTTAHQDFSTTTTSKKANSSSNNDDTVSGDSNIDYVAFAQGVAADNTIGYGHSGVKGDIHRNQSGQQSDSGISCTGLVSFSLDNAGFSGFFYDSGSYTMIPSIHTPLASNGFQQLSFNASDVRAGDILERTRDGAEHVAIALSSSEVIEATCDADGVPGDSSGTEISVDPIGTDWQVIWRLPDSTLASHKK